jgi:superfamily II DNA helicase RecQ
MRRNLSQERSVPAYIIFSDRTLRALSTEKPATKEELNKLVVEFESDVVTAIEETENNEGGVVKIVVPPLVLGW